jgi:transcriptional regulator with XRE-family HTH domain
VSRVSAIQDHDAVLPALGAAIREQRKSKGFSQESLADAAGIDRSHMGRIERGERNLTLLNLVRISTALKTRPSALLALADL